MATPSKKNTQITWDIDIARRQFLLRGECDCGVGAELLASFDSIPGLPHDRVVDAPVAALLTRRTAVALLDNGCPHAAHDVRWLSPTLFRPDRAKLIQALAVVTRLDEESVSLWLEQTAHRITWKPNAIKLHRFLVSPNKTQDVDVELEPNEAWELLASCDLVPFSWIGDLTRCFEDETANDATSSPQPTSLRSAITIAADIAGVLRAEAVAQELMARLANFGGAVPGIIRWRVVEPSRWQSSRVGIYTESLSNALDDMLNKPVKFAKGTPWWDLAAKDAEYATVWDAASDTRDEKSVAAIAANPLDPLLSLWLLGYSVDALTDEACTLIAPGV